VFKNGNEIKGMSIFNIGVIAINQFLERLLAAKEKIYPCSYESLNVANERHQKESYT